MPHIKKPPTKPLTKTFLVQVNKGLNFNNPLRNKSSNKVGKGEMLAIKSCPISFQFRSMIFYLVNDFPASFATSIFFFGKITDT